MANEIGAIKAGEAYVRYFARNDEFKRGNRDSENDFRQTGDRMRRSGDRFYSDTEAAEARHNERMRRERDKAWRERERAEDEYYRRMERKAQARDRANRDQENAYRTLAVGGAYAGGRLTATSSRMFGGILDSVREFGTVEASMLSLRTSVADNTTNIIKDMNRLEREAYKLGVKTEYGASDVAAMMERLGISNLSPDQIAKNSESVINLASVYSNQLNGKVSPAQAARTIMETINAQGMGIERIPEVADKMASMSREADINLMNLGDALRYAGSQANESGDSFDNLLATLIVLDKRGLKGEMGGTASRGIYASILDTTGEARDAYKSIGVDLPKKGNFNIVAFMKQLEAKLAHLTPIERAAVIAKAFPNRQMTGVQALVGASAEIEAEVQKIAASKGAASHHSANKREGVGVDLDVVGSAYESTKASFGKTFKDDVKWISQGLAGALESIGGVFEKYPYIGRSIGFLAAGLGALGLALGAAGTTVGVLAGLKLMNMALGTLGFTMFGVTKSVMGGVASMSMMALKATAWPVIVTSGLVGVGLAIDKWFNSGKLTESFMKGLDDVAAFFNGSWGKAGHWNPNEAHVSKEQFVPKTKTFMRDSFGQVIGEIDPVTGAETRYKTRASGMDLVVLGPDGRPIDRDTGAPLYSNAIGSSMSGVALAGGRLSTQQTAVAARYKRDAAQMERDLAAWADAQNDRSPENAKNAKAWREYSTANPIVPGFEEESRQQRADGWYSYLQNYRAEQARKNGQGQVARSAMAQLGDFELRGAQGQNFILDLLMPKGKKSEKDEIPEKMLTEQKRTNELLSTMGPDPRFLNKNKGH
jgi:TP901 family phage tail tape measure protein